MGNMEHPNPRTIKGAESAYPIIQVQWEATDLSLPLVKQDAGMENPQGLEKSMQMGTWLTSHPQGAHVCCVGLTPIGFGVEVG